MTLPRLRGRRRCWCRFVQTSGTVLALFPYEELAADMSPGRNVPRPRFSGITRAHDVRERRKVDEVLPACGPPSCNAEGAAGLTTGRTPS